MIKTRTITEEYEACDCCGEDVRRWNMRPSRINGYTVCTTEDCQKWAEKQAILKKAGEK